MTNVLRELKISFNDDGTVRAVKGDMWRVTIDENDVTDQKHVGTKNSFTAEELEAALPNAGLIAQVLALTAERDEAMAAKEAAETAKAAAEQTVTSLQAEFDALRNQPPEPTVPTVTALQGRLAINTVEGLRARVEAAVAAGGQNTKDFWEYALTWHRDNVLLVGLAHEVGLTDEQLDEMFAFGKTL